MKTRNSNKHIINIMRYYVMQYKSLFFVLLACIIATTFSGSTYPYILGMLIDKVFVQRNFSVLTRIVFIYVLVFLINQFLHFILNLSWAKLMVKYIYSIREDMFSVLYRLPAKELDSKKSGDIIQRINWDSEQFLFFIHKNIFYLIASLFEFIIALSMVFLINRLMGILVLVATPIVVYMANFFSKKIGKFYDKRTDLNGERNAWILEVIENIHEIKLLRANDRIKTLYSEQNDLSFDNKIDIAERENKIDQINKGILLIFQLGFFFLATKMIMINQITIGNIISILGYYEICISSFKSANKKMISMRSNKAGIIRCIEVLEMVPEKYNNSGRKHDIENAEICFENVSFAYNEGEIILDNINIKIHKNETFGIVGESGCGKSTLASLINKMYVPSKGKITIDGIDINDYQLNYLRQQIGIVYQDNHFFKGSIRFNLIFSNNRERDKELLDVIEKVGLKDAIDELPEGLDTIIFDGNIDFSGGQKQRLAIVRAYLKNPKIIIFDESTSALDAKSEEKVLQVWTNCFPNSTKIIISHRLSTIINADRIAVLNGNRIEMVGSHSELMKDCRKYNLLFAEQMQMEKQS